MLAVGSLAAAAWAAPAAAAPLDPAGAPDIQAAAQYLTAQLVDGTHYDPSGFGPDFGVTIDGALALAATGVADTELAAITDWVAANQGAYTFIGAGPGLEPYISGGEIAKVALLAQATGNDPRNFGGVDLLGELATLICADTQPIRQSACDGAGNYAGATSTFKQALGVIAQLRAGDDAAAPIAHLSSLQNADGGWPSLIPSAGGLSEVDSTAMAAMALDLAAGPDAAAAVEQALEWIAGSQQANGSFPGASGDSTNTTGLAIQALRLEATAYTEEILAAEAFLAAHQNADGGFDVNAADEGSELRASAQSLSGAAGVPFGSLLRSLPALAAGDDAAQFLVEQLVDGQYLRTFYEVEGEEFSFADQGLTADGVFALLAHGGYQPQVAAMTAWLETQVAAYADPTPTITPDTNPAFVGPYSGALAKLALVALSTGADPHAFGGFDLLGILADRICTGQDAAGTCTAAGDFHQAFSSISQSLGVLALQASPDDADHLAIDSAPVVRLSQLQCADGGFSSQLIAPGASCTSDVDATGFAVQALASVPGTDGWLGAAQEYLQAQQSAAGTFGGASGLNPDSTAQAAIALQVLTQSLYAPTSPSSAPALTPPIHAWQSALAGLLTFADAGNGFGVPDASPSNRIRSTTQAVLAARFRTLADLASAPPARTEPPVTPAPTTPPAAPAPTESAPTESEAPAPVPAAGPAAPATLAATGPEHASTLAAWGLALLGAGLAAVALARPAAPRRH
jgi:prenyltransferase beta subunit